LGSRTDDSDYFHIDLLECRKLEGLEAVKLLQVC
jgi:hypothetical protein